MSRTYRLRHLPQPEGGRSARRFVDSRLRHPVNLAEEKFVFHLAHVVLKLPCKIGLPPNYPVKDWGKAPMYVGWQHSHDRCLTREARDWLWNLRSGSPYYALGFARTMHLTNHPVIGYGLARVPSKAKRWARNQVYRRHRRHAKRLLRVLDWVEYGPGPDACCGGLCDPPWAFWVSGTEFDPDEMDFEERGIKAGLARSAWVLTW